MKKLIAHLERGDIVRAVFDPVRGHEQAGVRPALILSPGVINEYSSTVLVASLTSKRLDRILRVEVLVAAPEGGIRTDSKILLLQTRAIDKSRILGKYGALSDKTMREVDRALSIATGLYKV
jgi:mRNA interferase MazF